MLETLRTLATIASVPAALFGMLGVNLMLRARGMRALAIRRGLRYVGPTAVKGLGIPKIKPHLPFSRAWYPANQIRQAWNVVEGEEGGLLILMFDTLIGTAGGPYFYVSFIAAETEENPFELGFGLGVGRDFLESIQGWQVYFRDASIVSGFTTWSMSIRSLEHQLNSVRNVALSRRAELNAEQAIDVGI